MGKKIPKGLMKTIILQNFFFWGKPHFIIFSGNNQ